MSIVSMYCSQPGEVRRIVGSMRERTVFIPSRQQSIDHFQALDDIEFKLMSQIENRMRYRNHETLVELGELRRRLIELEGMLLNR